MAMSRMPKAISNRPPDVVAEDLEDRSGQEDGISGQPIGSQVPGHEVFFQHDTAEQQAAGAYGEHADPEGVVVGFLRDLRQRQEAGLPWAPVYCWASGMRSRRKTIPAASISPWATWAVR